MIEVVKPLLNTDCELASEKAKSKKLEAELKRKEKALAETAALLVLRGKASGYFGEGQRGYNDPSLRNAY